MTTPLSLEDLAYAAIRSGRAFARCWREAGVENRSPSRSLCAVTCDRLEEGRILQGRDLDLVDAMGEALRRALNAESTGYGDYALSEDTRYDALWDPRLEELRQVAEIYKHYRGCHERYVDRVTAEREAARAF